MHALLSANRRTSGDVVTRRVVSAITAVVAAITFTFSLGNVTDLCLHLGVPAELAWLPGAAVDLSVTGLLTGLRFLSLHGYTDSQLRTPRRMLLLCGALTVVLNTAGPASRHEPGTALVDAVCPLLLIGWSEAGPWLLRQINAIATADPKPVVAPAQPDELLASAIRLDAEHRAATGRPISRDTLRAQLRIGRDKAAALVATVRLQHGPASQPQEAAAA